MADRRGEKNGRAKLSAPQVLDIRQKYATGRYSLRALGREYRVSYKTIEYISKGVNWKHLNDAA